MNCILNLIYTAILLSILELHTTATAQLVGSHELHKLGWHIRCRLQPNSFDCTKNETTGGRYYYDIAMEACKTFDYGDCELSFNTFYTLQECSEFCQVPVRKGITEVFSQDITCRLQHDFGLCNNYFPMWYFDVSDRKCKGFSYSGCGGNGNRFTSSHICTAVCSAAVSYPKRAVQLIV